MDSITIARAAARMALTTSREEEQSLKAAFARDGIQAAAADYGGDFMTLLKKGVERAVVVAVREGLVADTEAEQGVVAGAAHEALSQILPKALGLSVGGKIGLARRGPDVSVAVFLSIGLLHLNEVAIAMGHRAITGGGQAQ
jgi:hypothetical protein